MPVTHHPIGTGLTARMATKVSTPFSGEDIHVLHRMFEVLGQNSTFDGIVTPWEALCQDVLRQAKLPPWDTFVRIYANGGWVDDLPEGWEQRPHELLQPGEGIGRAIDIAETSPRFGIDSQEWFAADILQRIDLVRHVSARGETASTAHLALTLGMRIATATLKFAWEADALLGKRFRERRPEGTKNSADTRGADKQARQNKVREAADKFWKQDPTITKEDVIRSLRKDKKFDEILRDVGNHSLRKDLQKPEEWSTVKSHKKSNP